jgi:hypothetical protein
MMSLILFLCSTYPYGLMFPDTTQKVITFRQTFLEFDVASSEREIPKALVYAVETRLKAQHCSLKNAAFWNEMPRGSCNNRRFGGTYRLHYQSEKNRRAGNKVSSN